MHVLENLFIPNAFPTIKRDHLHVTDETRLLAFVKELWHHFGSPIQHLRYSRTNGCFLIRRRIKKDIERPMEPKRNATRTVVYSYIVIFHKVT